MTGKEILHKMKVFVFPQVRSFVAILCFYVCFLFWVVDPPLTYCFLAFRTICFIFITFFILFFFLGWLLELFELHIADAHKLTSTQFSKLYVWFILWFHDWFLVDSSNRSNQDKIFYFFLILKMNFVYTFRFLIINLNHEMDSYQLERIIINLLYRLEWAYFVIWYVLGTFWMPLK